MRLGFLGELALLLILGGLVFSALPYLPSLERSIQNLSYHPPAEIAQLADQAQMTPLARSIFYRTQPVVDTNRTVFEQHCQAPVSSNLVELGCYTSDDHIFIMKITDPTLANDLVVVAAHEMLHAAYAGLSQSKLDELNPELEGEVTVLNNPKLSQELKTYRLTEPGQRENELHSLLGTEYAPLTASLETYYNQYFINRGVVVGFADQINQVFDSLQTELNTLQAEIRGDRSLLASDLRRGDIGSYNSLVPQLNSLISNYNSTVERYNQLSRNLTGAEQPAQSK